MLKISQHNKYTQPLLEPGAMLAQRLKKFEARKKVEGAGGTAGAGGSVDAQACSSYLHSHVSQPQPFCPVCPCGDHFSTYHSLLLAVSPGWQNCQLALDRPSQLLC